jgi:hypothetical protein
MRSAVSQRTVFGTYLLTLVARPLLLVSVNAVFDTFRGIRGLLHAEIGHPFAKHVLLLYSGLRQAFDLELSGEGSNR